MLSKCVRRGGGGAQGVSGEPGTCAVLETCKLCGACQASYSHLVRIRSLLSDGEGNSITVGCVLCSTTGICLVVPL